MQPESSGFVGTGRYDAAMSWRSPYDYRFSLECGIVTLLDGREKGIEIDMEKYSCHNLSCNESLDRSQ